MIGKYLLRVSCDHIRNYNVITFNRLGICSSLCCRPSRPRPSASPLFSSWAVTSDVKSLMRIRPIREGPVLENIKFSKFYCTTQPADPSEVQLETLKELIGQENAQIIDVREPGELENTGRIGKAVNIPVGEIADALQMTEDLFYTKYGHKKPTNTDNNIVFYCLMGIRSKRALDAAHSLGYDKSRHFPGGWAEWAKHNGLPV